MSKSNNGQEAQNEQQFKIIPDHVFNCVEADTHKEKIWVKQNVMGKFKINSFTANQLLQGIILTHKEDEHVIARTDGFNTVINLTDLMLNPQEDEEYTTFNRNQVKFFRDALDKRMKHCEIERDNEVMRADGKTLKFNDLTYIAMKMLLLDMREWLIGEEVDDDTENTDRMFRAEAKESEEYS